MEENRKNDEPRSNGGLLRGANLWMLLFMLLVVFLLFSLNANRGVSDIDFTDLLAGLEGKQYIVADVNAGNTDELVPLKDGEIGKRLLVNVLQDGKPIDGCNVSSIAIDKVDGSATGTFRVKPYVRPVEKNPAEWVSKGDKRLEQRFFVRLPSVDSDAYKNLEMLLVNKKVQHTYPSSSNATAILYTIAIFLPLVIILLFWISHRRSQNQMLGGGGFLSSFSRSPAKRYDASEQKITFKDVAGLEGVKADLAEIVDYLKEPGKFRRLGGRVPKGVLLNGPPGTGKTLLAKAVAGEADVPFFSVNGSEFIQMFVGVGASRVRDLFKTAKESAPAIIFIDEIDAVGRQRGAGLGGGNDEREQTLNQILSEMDGFMGMDSVIVVAATNRPDVLDPALLRPGRFDRHITVNRPTQKGRLAILKVHVKDVVLSQDVDLAVVAAGTIGMTGADICNLVNESALWAARNDKKKVEMEDFEYARDKIQMGAKREEVLTEKEKQKTAYHEAGHALAAWHLEGANPVHKVTVIPRGRALGVTQMIPDEDRLNYSESELRDHLIVLLGGRAAEKLIYNELSVGAENDLDRATGMARQMVTKWGMSPKLGPVSYKMSEDDPFLGREMHQQRQFSEATMELIDSEVALILQKAADDAIALLKKRKDELEKITEALMTHEEIDRKDIEELIGPSVHNSKPAIQALDEYERKKKESHHESNGDEKTQSEKETNVEPPE